MTQIDWDALLQFVGYGPIGPVKVLFLGLEEKAVEGERNLAARASFRLIEDLRDAHEGVLARSGCHNPFTEAHRDPVKQWNTAARFSLAFQGSPHWHERHAWSDYWRNKLGRTHGNTFLMECFPYPRPNRSALVAGAPALTPDQLWERRLPTLRTHLKQHPARFVIAYGKETKSKVAELLTLTPNAWSTVAGLKRPAEIAVSGATCIAHVGFFGRGYFDNSDIPTIVRAMRESASDT